MANLDFSKICRTCMQMGDMTDLFTNYNKMSCLVDKLMLCTFIQIAPNDGLPNQICKACVLKLNSAYVFAKKCEEIDKILREKLVEKTKINDDILTDLKSVYSDHNYDKKTSELVYTSSNFEQTEPKTIAPSPEETKDSLKSTKNSLNSKSKPPYVCKKCNAQFPLYHQLKEHFKTPDHLKTKYCERSCPICSKIVSYGHLKHHIRTHTSEKPYCCEICGQQFTLGSNLIRHQRVHSGEKPYKCDLCGKRFSQSTRMKDHRRWKHCFSIHTGEKPYVCSYCGKSFGQIGNFRFHTKKHEKEEAEKENGIDTDSSETNRKKDSKLKIKCEICNQIYESTGAYKTHLVTHGEKKFICPECGRGFTNEKRLLIHQKVHNAEKPFSCHICQKSFILKSSLQGHLKIHSGEKNYPCSFCDKAFVQMGQLKAHVKTHTGEKPYSCSVCGKRFALNGNLTVHMRTHTGETPYVCSFCDKGFYDSSSLKKHQKLHSIILE